MLYFINKINNYKIMKNLKLKALIHALATGVYITLIALFMQNGEKLFGKVDNLLAPIAFLLLFVLSAAVTGLLVLGKPILMYLEGKKKEAVKLFLYTVCWLFVLTIVALILGILI